MHVHEHDDHDCKKCKDKDKLVEEESDSSELDDDYDPDAVMKAPELETKQSSLKLQRKKTVMYPLKMTTKEKK